MKPSEFLELVLLASLWGASFLFMRVAAPEFGPVALAGLRVVIAAVMLFLDEEITVNMAAGTVIILVGTAMTTGLLSFNRRGAKASSG